MHAKYPILNTTVSKGETVRFIPDHPNVVRAFL